MDLQSLNPKVFEMWKLRRSGGPNYFQESPEEDIAELERLAGQNLPEDYKDFLRTYSTVGAVPKIGANYFPCEFPKKKVISYTFTLVPWAASTARSCKRLNTPDRFRENVGPRVPKELFPLTYDDYNTLLIDLRPDSYGHMLFLPEIKHKTFGTPGYGWDNIGYVAPSFSGFIEELGTEEELKARYPGRNIF